METIMADGAVSSTTAGAAAPIDRGHLAGATFGDSQLEHELLRLFDRQAVLLIGRIQACDTRLIGGLAHTLRGSAAGIGAWAVASAAEAAEQAASAADADRDAAISRLTAAIEEARAEIALLLELP